MKSVRRRYWLTIHDYLYLSTKLETLAHLPPTTY